jgi:Ni/Co efflux regulator RcnB
MNKIGMTAISSLAAPVAEAQEAGRIEAAAEDAHALEDILAARARAKARRTPVTARILRFLRLRR